MWGLTYIYIYTHTHIYIYMYVCIFHLCVCFKALLLVISFAFYLWLNFPLEFSPALLNYCRLVIIFFHFLEDEYFNILKNIMGWEGLFSSSKHCCLCLLVPFSSLLHSIYMFSPSFLLHFTLTPFCPSFHDFFPSLSLLSISLEFQR